MAGNYDNVDLKFTWNGDFSIKGGDLEDTASDHIQSLLQDVHTICASSLQDWEEYPDMGATLDDFLGEPNTPSTAEAVKDRIKASLVAANVVAEEDLSIRVIPIHVNQLLVIIGINAVATENNSLDAGDRVLVQFVFDSSEQQVFFLPKVPELLPR